MTPAFTRPLCRSCLHWKRRYAALGTCWHPNQSGITVEEHDTCDFHTPKLVAPVPHLVGCVCGDCSTDRARAEHYDVRDLPRRL